MLQPLRRFELSECFLIFMFRLQVGLSLYFCSRQILLFCLSCLGADVPGQVVLDHSTIVFDGTKIAVLFAVIVAIVIILALLCFEFADWFK